MKTSALSVPLLAVLSALFCASCGKDAAGDSPAARHARLVAALFLPPRPPGAELVFANGDRRDVRAANLAWSVPPPPLPASALRRLLSATAPPTARSPPSATPVAPPPPDAPRPSA